MGGYLDCWHTNAASLIAFLCFLPVLSNGSMLIWVNKMRELEIASCLMKNVSINLLKDTDFLYVHLTSEALGES